MKSGDGPNRVGQLIGEAIRRRRRQLRLTQSQLATQLGVHLQTVNRYERGLIETTPTRLNQIGSALKIDLASLLDEATRIAEVPCAPDGTNANDRYLVERFPTAGRCGPFCFHGI